MKTMKLFKLAFDIYMIVSKKPIGLIVLLFIPCFAVCQNSVDSTAVIQDCIATITDSLSQRNTTKGINPNAVKMQRFDPYKKKFTDMRIIETIGSHISR